jgi:hypothetical protein
MDASNDIPERFALPRWLAIGLVATAAAGLMAAFVSTLLESNRRGEALRESQRQSGPRPPAAVGLGAGTAGRQPQGRVIRVTNAANSANAANAAIGAPLQRPRVSQQAAEVASHE